MLEAEAYKRGFEVDDDGRMPSGQAWPRVLDLFAGSGALGIEALSRGAQHATFVEQSADAVQAIRANLRLLGMEPQASVHQAPAEHALARLSGPLDAALLDPPYEEPGLLAGALGALERAGLLHAQSVVVVEQAESQAPPPQVAMLPLRRTRAHGKTRVTLYAADPQAVRS